MANISFRRLGLEEPEIRKPSKVRLAILLLFLILLILTAVFIGLYVKEKIRSSSFKKTKDAYWPSGPTEPSYSHSEKAEHTKWPFEPSFSPSEKAEHTKWPFEPSYSPSEKAEHTKWPFEPSYSPSEKAEHTKWPFEPSYSPSGKPSYLPCEKTKYVNLSSDTCLSAGCITSTADILSKLDQSTNPCDDFYQYSCGGFLKKTFLPDGQQLVDSFSVATDFVQYSMREIFRNEQLMSSYSEGSAVQKAFTYYKSCTNEKNITDLGMQPILDVIEKHGSWYITNNDWSEEYWRLEKVLARVMIDLNTPAFLTLDVRPSFFNTSKMFITISGGRSAYEHEMLDKEQSRLVLKKEYDDDDDDQDSDIYKDYKIFMSKIFKLFGLDSTTTEKEVNRIVEMERGFIKAKTTHSSATSFRDVIKFMTVSELNRLTLFQFDWAMYLREALQDTNKLIVSDQKVMVLFPERIKAIVDWLVEKPKSLLANEIIWNGIRGLINTLPSAFREAQDEYVNSLYGITIPRWRTCNRLTDGAFSLATTLLYINEHLTENARKTAAEMFSEVKGQFIDGLDEQTWMDSTTRAQARLKLKDMGDLIGYPPIVKDPTKLNKVYENIQVDEYHLLQNTINAFKDQFSKKITKLEKSADRSSVASPTPISVNAYYSPQTNGMTILAGILQPPFYKDNRLKALNYGSLGMVVGHEITHGFDMTGSDFDEKGNIRQWWSSYSYKNFLKRSRCLIDEYNKVEIFGYKVNGKKTLSENIADNGGLKYAYRAYQKWRGIHGNEKKLPALPFNNDQLFFIGFAQQWCSKYSNKFAKVLINASVHSLDPVRVRVPLANFPEFSKAFGCTPRADTCTLW